MDKLKEMVQYDETAVSDNMRHIEWLNDVCYLWAKSQQSVPFALVCPRTGRPAWQQNIKGVRWDGQSRCQCYKTFSFVVKVL